MVSEWSEKDESMYRNGGVSISVWNQTVKYPDTNIDNEIVSGFDTRTGSENCDQNIGMACLF